MVSDLFLQKWKYWNLKTSNKQLTPNHTDWLPLFSSFFHKPFCLSPPTTSFSLSSSEYLPNLRLLYRPACVILKIKDITQALKVAWWTIQLVIGYFHLTVQMTFDLSVFFFKAVAFTGVVGFGAKQSNSYCVQMHTHSFCLFSL